MIYVKATKRITLRIKFGMDPTAPDLHLGHAVVLSKLRQLQDLGHEILLLIGDYTARIGDPQADPKRVHHWLEEQIKTNAKLILIRSGKILDPANSNSIQFQNGWQN